MRILPARIIIRQGRLAISAKIGGWRILVPVWISQKVVIRGDFISIFLSASIG
jgi:hypothetical protein